MICITFGLSEVFREVWMIFLLAVAVIFDRQTDDVAVRVLEILDIQAADLKVRRSRINVRIDMFDVRNDAQNAKQCK